MKLKYGFICKLIYEFEGFGECLIFLGLDALFHIFGGINHLLIIHIVYVPHFTAEGIKNSQS